MDGEIKDNQVLETENLINKNNTNNIDFKDRRYIMQVLYGHRFDLDYNFL